MHDLIVTIDLGNTRCKLRAWSLDAAPRSARPIAEAECASGAGAAGCVTAFLRGLAGVRTAALCAVASAESEQALVAALLSELGPTRVLLALEPGLVLDVREPARVGRDRLFAARGAFERTGGDALVLDAGTALTVDALRVRTGIPHFLGGAIAPGPRLLAQALHAGTARLPLVEPEPGTRALGRDTAQAVRAGVVVGFRGAARELAARVAEEAGIERAPVVLTGGAAVLLLEPELFPGALFDAELVHRGLLAAALQAGAAR